MFEESHETLEGLRRLFAGQTSPFEEARAAAHLTGCRDCWLLAARAIAAQKASGVLVVQGPLRKLVELHEEEQERSLDWLEAPAAWPEIQALTTKARRDKVRLTRSLHTFGFLEFLLEAGAEAAAPAESEEFFILALFVAGQLPSSRFSNEMKNDLCAECCMEIANARRRLARWPAARDSLKKGLDYAARGARNGVAEGKVLCVEGVLEDDLGNSDGAAKLLRRAIELFEAAGQTFLRSRTLAQLAYVLVETDPAESLRIIEQALALIPADNPRLAMFAEGIKIACLIALDAPQEALLRLIALQPLHKQFREPFTQLRRKFTAARILESLGRHRKAEILFEEAVAGDLEHGLVKDYFLDLVYLFGFHLRRGQKDAAIAVCRRGGQDLSPLIDEEEHGEPAHDQMRTVWRSLEEEVKKGKIDLGVTTVLKNYIKAHWRTPASEPPSFGPSTASE
jgi:tetratricopeptide (TPR) repeat protein